MEITTPTRETRPRGRQPVNVLTPAFVRNVARAPLRRRAANHLQVVHNA